VGGRESDESLREASDLFYGQHIWGGEEPFGKKEKDASTLGRGRLSSRGNSMPTEYKGPSKEKGKLDLRPEKGEKGIKKKTGRWLPLPSEKPRSEPLAARAADSRRRDGSGLSRPRKEEGASARLIF